MSLLWEVTAGRLKNIQLINGWMSPNQLADDLVLLRKKILQEQLVRSNRQDEMLSHFKSTSMYNCKQCPPIREFYQLSTRVMAGLEFDVQCLDDHLAMEYQDEDLLKVMASLFSNFFEFVGNYFELKDSVRSIFRSNNKTLVHDMVRYLIVFTRDYLGQVLMAACKQRGLQENLTRKVSKGVKGAPQRAVTEPDSLEPKKTRKIRTEWLLNVQENAFRIAKMPTQSIVQKANSEFQTLKRRNANIFRSLDQQNKLMARCPTIKICYDHLYSQEQIRKLAGQRHSLPQDRVVAEGQHRFQILRKFAQKQLEKEAEANRRVRLHKPRRISDNCPYGLKFTHNVARLIDLVEFQKPARKLSLNLKLPVLLQALRVSPITYKRKTGAVSPNKTGPTSIKSRQALQVQYPVSLVASQNSQAIRNIRNRSVTLQREQHTIPRSKIIKLNTGNTMLPDILKKLCYQPCLRSKTNPEEQAKDNFDLRSAVAFDRIKKKDKDKDKDTSAIILGIISKQVYNIYV